MPIAAKVNNVLEGFRQRNVVFSRYFSIFTPLKIGAFSEIPP
jgi:hypothetical protein